MIISIHRFELTLQYHINSHLSYNETSVRKSLILKPRYPYVRSPATVQYDERQTLMLPDDPGLTRIS